MQTFEPAMDQNDFELERFLPYRLSLLTNTISQGIAASYRDGYGISVTEWRILAVLGRFPGMTASEVVDRTAMDKVAIHRAVKTLVDRNLLERRTDKDDRRRQKLFITPDKGQNTLDSIVPKARAFETRLLEALTPKETQSFLTTLKKLQSRAIDLKAEK
jgi:DNA-binding MarR family transcriptional regulator